MTLTNAGKPRILFVVGSLRERSLNRQMAEVAIALIADRAETDILDWGDVPPFNQDAEFPAPDSVARVRAQVAQADALWFATPENNHSIPGVLKNLLDWLSRPPASDEASVIAGKVATASTVAGSFCGRYVQAALLPVFDFPAAPFACAAFDRAQLTSSELAVTEAVKVDLARQVDALLEKLS